MVIGAVALVAPVLAGCGGSDDERAAVTVDTGRSVCAQDDAAGTVDFRVTLRNDGPAASRDLSVALYMYDADGRRTHRPLEDIFFDSPRVPAGRSARTGATVNYPATRELARCAVKLGGDDAASDQPARVDLPSRSP